MKRKLISAISVISVLLVILSACSGAASKNSTIDTFSERVKSITNENSELASYSMDGLTAEGSGTYAATALIDGTAIGAVSIAIDNEQITELSFSFFGDVEINKCVPAVTASAMAVDSALDYL